MLMNVHRLLKWPEKFVWESSRSFGIFQRRFGIMGWLIAACATISITLMLAEIQQLKKLDALQRQIEESQDTALRTKLGGTQDPSSTDGRALLRMFEENLLSHEDIPVLVQGLLQIAEEEGVLIRRGDYRIEADAAGGFMRYRMDLPVQGTASAIDSFIQRSLTDWKALALSNARFMRSEIGSGTIESRLQWVAMIHMPKTPARLTSGGTQ
ncbi:MAG: hypothetical protein FWF12_07135 [Betaproteobacteria bacterium]|nr:hypothetical protein [Betaproteobacteria bacterium]